MSPPLPVWGPVHEALARLDGRGDFSAADLDRLRSLVADAPAPDHPEEIFGSWCDLPDVARETLRRGVEAELAGMLAARPRGWLWHASVRGLLTLDRAPGARHLPSALSPSAWAQRLWARPARTRDWLAHSLRRRRWRAGRGAGPLDLLAHFGYAPTWLLGDFAQGVAVDPRVQGFRADRARGATAGYLIGLDLVHAPDGVWCIEANLNAALRDERGAFYDHDPIVRGLLDFARASGADSLTWFGAGQAPLCDWLIDGFRREASAQRVRFELVESPRLPRRGSGVGMDPPPRRAGYPPRTLPDATLFVRVRSYGCGPDLVITDKDLFVRALADELTRRADPRVRVPLMSPAPGATALPNDPGLPNLVYKYPREDRGAGVHFMRVERADDAEALARDLDRRTGEQPGRFQPFVCSRLLEGRRFYDVRAFVFVSPAGVAYLGGLRKEAGAPVPERLAPGIVEDRRPFSMSGFLGRTYEPLGPEDEEPVRQATLAVGEALAGVLARAFRAPG